MKEDCNWAMDIHFGASNFEMLKGIALNILAEISKAKSFKELPVMGGGSGGYGCSNEFSVVYKCPDEIRIAQLRKEADDLERGLSGIKP